VIAEVVDFVESQGFCDVNGISIDGQEICMSCLLLYNCLVRELLT